ncbi:MAG TPA: N-acetylmuramoyl-L-alanine amidase [Acidimicrobiia bacterium]
MSKWLALAGLLFFFWFSGAQPAESAPGDQGTESVKVTWLETTAGGISLPLESATSEPIRLSAELEASFDMVGLLWDSGRFSHLWLQVRDENGAWGDWLDVPVDEGEGPDSGVNRMGSAPVYTGGATAVRFAAIGDTVAAEAMLLDTELLAGSDSQSTFSSGTVANYPPAPSWAGASFVMDRSNWDTQGCRREGAETDYSSARAVVIHHTAASNSYTADQVPGIILGHCLYHVNGRGWDDIGYNFLVDRFGGVWEGRTGSKSSPVQGAHTAGFNSQTQGVAMMGNFDIAAPSTANIDGLRMIVNWLTGWHSIDPNGSVSLTAGSGAVGFDPGEVFTSETIVGHRDLGSTSCPGDIFYATLISFRATIVPLNFGFDPATLTCDGKTPTIFGSPGNDLIFATDDADIIHAIFGHDWVFGLGGNDSICGSAGDDVLIGGTGEDRSFGGSGSDSCGGEESFECESVPNDEIFFYRSQDGVFKYYQVNPDGSLGAPIKSGTYSTGWSSITKVDLDGDGLDEFFFYRKSDGVFKYYDVNPDGSLGAPILAGVYSTGWDSITAVDLDGDFQDEFFFYRSADGTFKYYEVNPDGSLGAPIVTGVYSTGWSAVTKVDLDGDFQDEFFFYRSADGTFKYYEVNSDGSLGAPISSGFYSTGWDSITAVDLDGAAN